MRNINNKEELIKLIQENPNLPLVFIVCQKEIPNFDETRDLRKSRYFEVTTGHRLWGNDSLDSIRDYNICPNCIQKFIKDYIEKVENTYYIDIETTVASEEKYSDEEYEEGE